MAHFDLSQYQTVQQRVDLLRERWPYARIVTAIEHVTDTQVIARAEIYLNGDEMLPTCVDFAHEVAGSSMVNKTSWVENCVTSAIGRAISLLGGDYSPKGAKPSREEMEKVQRSAQKQTTPAQKSAKDDKRAQYATRIAEATTLADLEGIYAEAIDDGLADILRPELTARKNALKPLK